MRVGRVEGVGGGVVWNDISMLRSEVCNVARPNGTDSVRGSICYCGQGIHYLPLLNCKLIPLFACFTAFISLRF